MTDARTTAELAREQYVSGVVDTRTVLESERELLAAEENHAKARQEILNAVVDIYRAMGGSDGTPGSCHGIRLSSRAWPIR